MTIDAAMRYAHSPVLMTPASEIIDRCGGFEAVSKRLRLDRSGVQRWTYPPPKGTGGRVPTKHWATIIELAAECGRSVTLDDLIPPEAMKAARKASRQAA